MKTNATETTILKGPKTERWFHTATGFGRLLRVDTGWYWIKLFGNPNPVLYRPEHPDLWEAKPCPANGGFVRVGGAK